MAVPTRPAAGAPIETAWGDVVHDGVVAMEIQTGTAILVFSNVAVSAILVVTFPHPFASTPLVFLTPQDTGNITIGLRAKDATSFQMQGRDSREAAITANSPIGWIAYGPRV